MLRFTRRRPRLILAVVVLVLGSFKLSVRELNAVMTLPDGEVLSEEVVMRIACGSCYKPSEDVDERVWGAIGEWEPELFLFMGDNIYGDTEDMELLRSRYADLLEKVSYQRFHEGCMVLATWDDHDYGADNAGVEFAMKEESQEIFLDAFGFSGSHPARFREGIYHSYFLGPEGQRLQVINLDTRYHRTEPVRGEGERVLVSNERHSMLGDAQWEWLEGELMKPADLRVIVSSVQVINDTFVYERWALIPGEREHLFDLLRETNARNVVLLSGDLHFAEISSIGPEESGLDYELVEMTCSGMTHAGYSGCENGYRVPGSFYNGRHFGGLEIRWRGGESPEVRLSVRSLEEVGAPVVVEKVVGF